MPDGVSLETITIESADGGRTRVPPTSLVDAFRGPRRRAGQRHGDEVVVGHDELDELLAQG